MFVRVFQAVVISVAFIGWILYQLMNKKKRLAELTNDIFAIVFFVSIWLGIFYFLIS
jgi:polyferredoxin